MTTTLTELLEQMPPASPESERALLGSILLGPSHLDDMAELVAPEDFHDPANGKIFAALLKLRAEGKVDHVTLVEQLRATGDFEAAGGRGYIAKIVQSVPVASHASYYAKLVCDASTRRKLREAGAEILQLAHSTDDDTDGVLAKAEQRVFGISESRSRVSRSAPIGPALLDAMAAIDERATAGSGNGIPTGFRELDDLTGGMHDGALWIIGARPSGGKTALALNVATNVAVHERQTVLLVSLEMSRTEISERLLATTARVNSHHIRNGALDRDEQRRLVDASQGLADIPLIVDDAPALSVSQIAATARRHKRQDDLRLIVIDYLTLIQPDNPRDPRQEQVAKISRRLKCLARDIGVPVLCAAQLRREADGTAPRLGHLRESGAIEQDADVVAFIHKPSNQAGVIAGASEPIELVVAKNRSGPTGKIDLVWLPKYVQFGTPAAERCEALDTWSDGSDQPYANAWSPDQGGVL